MRRERSDRPRGEALVVLLAVAALGFAGCTATTGPRPAPAESGEASVPGDLRAEESAVIAAHRELVAAVQRADVEGVLARLDPTDELLIFHPYVENRFDGVNEARDSLVRMFARLPASEWTEVHPRVSVRDGVAWLTYQVLLKSESVPEPFVGRGTEIWTKRDVDWRLIHAHWSEHARIASAARGAAPAP